MQPRGVKAGAREDADRVHGSWMTREPRRFGIGEEDRRLPPDLVARASDADHGDGACRFGGSEA